MFTAYETLKAIAKIYSALFARPQVHGCFPLPGGPKIIAANHTLASDALQIPLVIEEKLLFLAQANLFTLPIVGRMLGQSGQIPVEQGDNKGCIALKHACRALRDGKTLVIFPEGRLVPPAERIPARSGVIRMALQTGAPIIPLGIYVPLENITGLSIHRLGKKRTGLWQTSGRCHLTFGAPWNPRADRHKEEHLQTLTNELMNKIYTLVAETKRERACVLPILLKPTHQL
ncbi:MAG TPA: lysophospholipid acyltransferase family protein [Anaerolineales bacterium]|nr:lysophospholipid acyltransferase family protein [Anaerolineales bacterium]